MPILIECPSCSSAMKAPDNSAGKSARCPRCQTIFPITVKATAPAPSAASPKPAAAPPFPPLPVDPDDEDDGLEFLPADVPPPPPANYYAAPASGATPAPTKGRGPLGAAPISFVRGKPALAWGNAIVPGLFGSTIFRLTANRLVEETRRPVESRECEVLLHEIDSGEMLKKGNGLFILFGFLTLPIFGIGLLFFALFFLFKHRFLVFRTGSNALVLTVRGDDYPYRQFLDDVLTEAERVKRGG